MEPTEMPQMPRDWSSHPPYLHEPYRSTALRAPTQPPVALPAETQTPSLTSLASLALGPLDHDLSRNARRNGEPLGERITVSGRLLDDAGAPLPGALIELWQANAAGRYVHRADQHDAPLDPNFDGAGRCLTDANGDYRFVTLRPGAYPWGNHDNAWRPAHIHFSVLGHALGHRLVTQMYFPGDPLLEHDPIYQGVPSAARERLVARFDLALTEPGHALGYRFNMVVPALRGREQT